MDGASFLYCKDVLSGLKPLEELERKIDGGWEKVNYEHVSLRVLSKKISEEAVLDFVNYMRGLLEAGEKERADAVLQVSVSANRKLYDDMRRRSNMCEALRELMKDEIEEELSKARNEGKQTGIQTGIQTGEERLNKLYAKLEQDDRKEDIFRAMKDAEFLKELYKEYNM